MTDIPNEPNKSEDELPGAPRQEASEGAVFKSISDRMREILREDVVDINTARRTVSVDLAGPSSEFTSIEIPAFRWAPPEIPSARFLTGIQRAQWVNWASMERDEWPRLSRMPELTEYAVRWNSRGAIDRRAEYPVEGKYKLIYQKNERVLREREVEIFKREYSNALLSTEPADREAAEDATTRLYKICGFKKPKFIWCDSPDAITAARRGDENLIASILASNLPPTERVTMTVDTVERALSVDTIRIRMPINIGTGEHLALSALAHECHMRIEDRFLALIDLVTNCGGLMPTEKVAYLCEHPAAYRWDSRDRLHSENSPAIEYRDGTGVYIWHNVAVPRLVITNPQSITVQHIENEKNTEIRRVMIERFGADRYIQETGAELGGEDEFGRVWVKRMGLYEEPIVVVEVINSTPEPDGTNKHYWLRVDPNAYLGMTRTCPQAAVASTWRNDNGRLLYADYRDYRPMFES